MMIGFIFCEACKAQIDDLSWNFHVSGGKHLVVAFRFELEKRGFVEVTSALANELADAGIPLVEGPNRFGYVNGEGRCVVTGTGVWAPQWCAMLNDKLALTEQTRARVLAACLASEQTRGAVIALLESSPPNRRWEDGIYHAVAELCGFELPEPPARRSTR